MGVKRGDILDERKRHPDSCGLVVKVMGGGEGFEKIVCCGHELTITSMQELKFGQLRNPAPTPPGPTTNHQGTA